MIWGTYHGLLLVTHRQWQELRKRLGVEWSGALATGISWLLTFTLVCAGYIFFRANSVGQAFTMFAAILSPSRYHYTTLPASLYGLVLLTMAGYFAVLGASAVLDHLRDFMAAWPSDQYGRLKNVVVAVSSERWVWVAPIVIVLAIYLSVIFRPGHADTGPVMYALF